jgi:hypothetical protein
VIVPFTNPVNLTPKISGTTTELVLSNTGPNAQNGAAGNPTPAVCESIMGAYVCLYVASYLNQKSMVIGGVNVIVITSVFDDAIFERPVNRRALRGPEDPVAAPATGWTFIIYSYIECIFMVWSWMK